MTGWRNEEYIKNYREYHTGTSEYGKVVYIVHFDNFREIYLNASVIDDVNIIDYDKYFGLHIEFTFKNGRKLEFDEVKVSMEEIAWSVQTDDKFYMEVEMEC